MEVVLEETCRFLPHGGEHALRAFIAQRLGEAVESGRTTIGQLTVIARKAFGETSNVRLEAAGKRETSVDGLKADRQKCTLRGADRAALNCSLASRDSVSAIN
jgi:hypothetical protein